MLGWLSAEILAGKTIQFYSDIVCNLDADNYLGEGFAAYILNLFCMSDEKVFSVTLFDDDPEYPGYNSYIFILENDQLKLAKVFGMP